MSQRIRQTKRGSLAAAGGIERLHEVATGLFAQRGYGETSMKEIADALGIQPPSIYNYVSSKQAILDAVCLETMQGAATAVKTGLTLCDDVVVQVKRGIEEQVRYRLAHSDAILVLTRETLNLSPRVRTDVIALRDEQREMWFQVIERGVHEGVFTSPNSRLTALLLQDMCNWLQLLHFTREQPTPTAQLIYWYGEQALNLLMPAPRRPI
ncbi:TetR/AcrR family transcriptional regulator [Streptosporangium sp. NPDC051022]|uniref:TetR/AcrR family transcriptional regulator n=1 Tax=Streptosporangium sp. NPDC051022 TaxID=3155752 RepID=UPI0034120955